MSIEEALRAIVREELAGLREELRALAAKAANDGPTTLQQKMLGVRQAGVAVGRCPDTLRRAIARGDLKASKPAGSREWLIASHDLLAWASADPSIPAVDFNAEVEKVVSRVHAGRKRGSQ